MGLFGNRKSVSASDAEVIMLAMILSVAADGTIEAKEGKTLLGLAVQFPAFSGKDIDSLFRKGCDAIVKGGIDGALKTIAGASPEVKAKAFIAAVECAYSSGNVENEEAALLDKMADALALANGLAEKCVTVFEAKYC